MISVKKEVKQKKNKKNINKNKKAKQEEIKNKVKDFILKTCKNNDWLIEKITSTKSDKKIIRCLTNAIR